MISEYGLRLVSAVLIGIYVARYLGPEKFGLLSYSSAIVTIFITVSQLGMANILVRDLAKCPERILAYMSTAFSLMMLAAIASFTVLSVCVFFIESDIQARAYIWVIAAGIIFQPFNVIDYYFQSQVKVKHSSVARLLALAISSSVKVYLVWTKAGVYVFAIAMALDYVLVALLLTMSYLNHHQECSFEFDRSLVKPLLKSAWPMVLSALAATLYIRIDQIMIKNMIGSHELGLYMVASKFFEVWVSFVYVVSMSLMPLLVENKKNDPQKYEMLLVKVFRLFMFSGIVFYIFMFICGESVIEITFGLEYKAALTALIVLSLGAPLIAIRVITVRYLTVEGFEKKIASRTIAALGLSIVLNYILIPKFGVVGAAVSTVFALFYSAYLANFLDSELSYLRKIHVKIFSLKSQVYK